MHLHRKRLLLGLILLAGLYIVLYLLPANLFLGTGLGQRLLNRRPERLRVEWGSAWSLWPGAVEVRGFRIEGDNRRVRWAVAVDRGRGRIGLLPLLSKELRVSGFEGEGVSSRVTRHPPQAPAPPPRARRRPWTLRFDELRLSRVRAVQYGPLRLEGEGRAAGSFHAVFGEETEVELRRLEMEGARLSAAGRPVAHGVSLRTALRLGPYAPRRHPGAAGFDFLSGTLQATGEMEDLPVFRKVSGSGIPRPGRLALDLRVERGVLRPRSRVALEPRAGSRSRMAVTGSVTSGPMGPRLFLQADLGGFILPRGGGRPPLLESEALDVSAATSELRLSRLLALSRDLRDGRETPGWTLPGELRAEGLRLTFPGSRASLEIAAGHATGRIDLPALLRREVRLDGVRGEEALLRVTAGTPPPDRMAEPPKRRWSTSVTDLRLEGGGDVALANLHLDGRLAASGDLSWKDGALALDNVSLALSDGGLEGKDGPLARALSVQAGVRFGPYRREGGSNWIDFLSGTLRGSGTVTTRAVRSGRLTLDLQAEKGALLPGSKAELRGPRLAMTGSVVPQEGGPRLALDADLRGFVLGQGRSGPPLLASDVLRVTAGTSELRLARLFATARDLRGGAQAGGTLPGELEAEGLRVYIPGSRVTLRLAAARASGRTDLSALLRREVRLDRLRAERARVRLTGGAPVPARAAGATGNDWTAKLADLRLDGGCEIDLGGLRFDSGLQAGGDLAWDGAALTVGRAALGFSRGRLRSGRETVARGLTLQADGRLDPFDPGKVEGMKTLRLVSGRAAAGGAIASLGFLDPYLAKATWLDLDGDGELQVDFRLDRGRLLSGSRFSVRPARIRADYLLSRATGAGALTGTVARKRGGDELSLRVDFDRFAIGSRERPAEPPHIRGRGLRLALVTGDLDLASSGKDFRARLDLPQADVTDLTFYNTYLPQQSGMEIVSGTGRIKSWLEMETVGDTGRGEVAIQSQAVRLRLYDRELAGALDFRAPLAITDLRRSRLRLDGTRLSLDRVALREAGTGEEAPPDWWARLDLARATMDWTRPMSLTSSVRLAMKDSGLLLSLFAQRKRYLRWFQGVLDVEDVAAVGDLRFDQGAVVLDPLRVTGRDVELRSRLRMSRESKRGYLLVRYKRLVVGLELQDGKRDYRFVRPQEWFESRGAP
jgi:hypothetical protein